MSDSFVMKPGRNGQWAFFDRTGRELSQEEAAAVGTVSVETIRQHPEWKLGNEQRRWNKVPPHLQTLDLMREKFPLVYRTMFPDGAAAEPAAEPRGSSVNARRKNTKEATTQKVYAAIAFKMQNPTWNQTQCAKAADVSPTTLGSRPDWIEWYIKIESASASQKQTRKVKQEFDRRIGQQVLVDPNP